MSRQSTGDYGEQHQINHDVNVQQIVLAADAGPFTLITPRDSNETVHVQRIYISITTYAAKTWTLQDSAGTPVQVALASIPAAAVATPGVNVYSYDFGPHGFALTKGKNLTLTLSAAGAAGVVTVDGFSKREAGAYTAD